MKNILGGHLGCRDDTHCPSPYICDGMKGYCVADIVCANGGGDICSDCFSACGYGAGCVALPPTCV
jgi:hypothetical protein